MEIESCILESIVMDIESYISESSIMASLGTMIFLTLLIWVAIKEMGLTLVVMIVALLYFAFRIKFLVLVLVLDSEPNHYNLPPI